ncbi:isochorismatase family protein [Clostridium hydrogenum]|uniref:isochorismatase family protein n=1 Tax=Clostridium hydrogenum TaxID=2855764 RepID=UPI001F3DFA7B|nr:isochorismatase family protein [Clostridium hydrogenum]
MEKIIDKDKFIEKSKDTLLKIIESFENLQTLKVSDFKPENTVIVNVDLINGFCKEGNLSSELVAKIIPYTVKINEYFKAYQKVFFVDKHTKESAEFNSYIEHCIENTSESEIIDELKPFVDGNSTVCFKNSVNGFLCDDYTKWLKSNMNKTNIIVLGDVTDICVMNYCLSQKTFFNEKNIASRIIIPIKGVETYDLDITNHNAELMNLFALYNMRMNGIEIIEDIEK